MSYDRSLALQEERVRDALDPPPSYRRRPSIQGFLRWAVPIGLGTIFVIAALWLLLGFRVWYAVILLVAWYFVYREYYKWSRNYRTCHPTDGVLHIEEHSHPIILFFINGSPDNQIPLDDVEMDTPTISFLDRWVFHCATLILGSETLKDLKGMDELLAIQKYRESLKKEAITLDKQQVSVQMAILETLESMGRDLKTLVRLMVDERMPQPLPPTRTPPTLAKQRPSGSVDEEHEAEAPETESPQK